MGKRSDTSMRRGHQPARRSHTWAGPGRDLRLGSAASDRGPKGRGRPAPSSIGSRICSSQSRRGPTRSWRSVRAAGELRLQLGNERARAV